MTREMIEIGGTLYRRFIPYPGPVNDGTARCITCGQIDEPEYHDAEECLARKAEVDFYRAGDCRNDPKALSHTYAQMKDGNLWPMCGYGWNRSDGAAFSIFRGSPGTEGDCKICRKNVAEGKRPAFTGIPHKTRWL